MQNINSFLILDSQHSKRLQKISKIIKLYSSSLHILIWLHRQNAVHHLVLVQVCYCTLGRWSVMVLHNGSCHAPTEIVLLDQALLQCTLCRKQLVQVLVCEIRMQTHHLQCSALLLSSLILSSLIVVGWLLTWRPWNSRNSALSLLVSCSFGVGSSIVLSFILVESSGSSVFSVVSESTFFSFTVVFSDLTMLVWRTSAKFSVTSVITDGLLKMRK